MASWVDVQPNARRAGNNPEERSMRSKLLISTAALLAGGALASAQNMPGGGREQGPAHSQGAQSQGAQGGAAGGGKGGEGAAGRGGRGNKAGGKPAKPPGRKTPAQ